MFLEGHFKNSGRFWRPSIFNDECIYPKKVNEKFKYEKKIVKKINILPAGQKRFVHSPPFA